MGKEKQSLGDRRMSVKITDKITVKREKFDKIVDIVNRDNLKEISFEFLVGSCFPKVLKNIKEEMRRQYTLGYIEGQKKEENDD